jgi:uncharacterized protein with PhoU and TrkA domain
MKIVALEFYTGVWVFGPAEDFRIMHGDVLFQPFSKLFEQIDIAGVLS